MITYADYTLMVQDRLNDSNIASDLPELIQRQTNRALRKINRGEISGRKKMRSVGYDFQKEILDVTYTAGTELYTFSTLSLDSGSFKFPWDMRIDTDENVMFELWTSTKFRRKRGVFQTRQAAFAMDNDAGTKQMLIYYGATDTLDFEYFTTNIITDGTTRKASITDTGNDYFLLQDEDVEMVADLTAAFIVRGIETDSKEGAKLMKDGEDGLLSLIESHGIYEKKPMDQLRVRSEWNNKYVKMTKN